MPEKKSLDIGKIKEREISQEMRESYLDYAMSVIVSRALPDVRDGLKPVHRRILYSMYEDGLRHNAKFRKSANVVGLTLARYHPHGDQAVYDALVRMAQDFSLRYPLIEGQGNFGSIDGDSPAAQRYTECRLSAIGEELLKDIEKETINFRQNYDGTRKEPEVLPAPYPQLLANGSLGIAVGMATNIPPHNLKELIEATVFLIDNQKATTEDLFQFIKGPDFPTGGIIYGKEDIISAYSQGKGGILVRGRAEIEKEKGERTKIIIYEIPFQVQKSSLLQQIAKLVEEKKIEGIKDIRDESDREGMRIVIELKTGTFPLKILQALYKYTDLQKTFHLNLLALVDGIQPKILSLVDLLNLFLKHKKEVVLRRTKYDLKKAKEREHILKGLVIALANIDEVIKTIKKSNDRQDAFLKLQKKFKLSPVQANAILEMRLQNLAKLEREKIEKELKEIKKKIKKLEAVLKSKKKLKEVMKKELLEIKERFGDERKTQLVLEKPGEIRDADLIPHQETIITLTESGYIKRTKPSLFRTQRRGGKGISGGELKEDLISNFVLAQTLDKILFFTDSGKVFQCIAWEIPEASRLSKGRGIMNFLNISQNEKILSIVPYSEKEISPNNFLVTVTKNGIIKKTPISAFGQVRKNGLKAIKLQKGDLLCKAKILPKGSEIILVTRKGKSIRFKEKDIRAMQRGAAGVRGIRLSLGDEVVGMDIIEKQRGLKVKAKKYFLLTITENGFGKLTDISEYRVQKRGGSGIKCAKITSKTGNIVFSEVVEEKEKDLLLISERGQVIRVPLGSISKLRRQSSGVRVMKLAPQDKVVSGITL